MHKIKQIPEDFIVKEINEVHIDGNGAYSYFLLKKRNYDTIKAIQSIAKKSGINEKSIGFAGNKDRNAITEQIISIKNGKKDFENIIIKDIELKYLGKGNEEIYIGSLKGNGFAITIRNLTKKEISRIEEKPKHGIFMPNYFGPQRFSSNNALIGKSIIKNNFREAADLIVKSNSEYNKKINNHLQKQKNDFIGALKIIPFKLLKLYIHSYQSLLFNKTLEQYIKTIQNQQKLKTLKNRKAIFGVPEIKRFLCISEVFENSMNFQNNNKKTINNKNKKSNENVINAKLPIIGFATEISNKEIEAIINKIMEEEQLGIRDFIVRAIPDLSSEGSERNAFVKINDFKIISIEKDELNENKEKIILKFSLPKGSYATVLIEYLFS